MDTKQIRKELKSALGYNARQVSVKRDGSSITFTVRDSSVHIEAVKQFGEQFEVIRRDEYTQCILRGGNTFVNVRLSEAVKNEFKKKWLPVLEEVAPKIDGSCLEKIPGTDFLMGKDYRYHDCYALWGNDHIVSAVNLDYLAVELAQLVTPNTAAAPAPDEKKHTLEKGDIVYNSWGYEQTNIDFYQVVKATRCFVTLRPIQGEKISDGPLSMTGKVIAKKDCFTDSETTRHKAELWNGESSVKFQCGAGRKWDGTPKRYSTYA
ncbi:hypothetical protein [Pseudodesulfovibrio senegalensis]|uniref:Large polyvalent protein associated domain-containing protein n=1 Tax=Pseudodesulfovibrio senegalensis TaxID=1721087 RepID=A0A6N6MY59_9BACT|nr:hypothetical protein [Pseudodesulfovibrio senegalensis]KAB1437313.1 hypothetical protein F8A88_15415 [Pseudodesulfovibrio senegalensis]